MSWKGATVILVLVALLTGIWAVKGFAPKPDTTRVGHDHDDHGPERPDHSDEKSKEDEHDGHDHADEKGKSKSVEGLVRLSSAQIEKAAIDVAPAASGTLVKEISVPGQISLNLNRKVEIVPKVSGIVFKVKKNLGDEVHSGEAVAILESREIAEAKGDYMAAYGREQLARSSYERERRLWKQRVTAEQDFLNARAEHQLAKIKLEQAHQRLHASGLEEKEIDALSGDLDDEEKLRLFEVRSPISGRVIGRDLIRGQIVSTDKSIYTIADLSTVWVEVTISPGDLSFARVGQDVLVQSGTRTTTGKVIVVSPVTDPKTRNAKAVIELENSGNIWQPGDFVTAQLAAAEYQADIIVPKEAVQSIKGAKAVFVSHKDGFMARFVTTGREDSRHIEILTGLEFGELIAVKNVFTLTAELGKAEAEHAH